MLSRQDKDEDKMQIKMKIKMKIRMKMKMKGKRKTNPHNHQGIRLAFSKDLPTFSP